MEATGGSGASATQYDVFLSFRGPDTRNNFTDYLYRTMDSQGIFAYRDSEDLHAGDRIDDLLRAVRDSKICIPVLSRGYASSAWCLRELARATELNESTRKPAILPIFFDVTPSDVKLRTQVYVEDLEKHERRHGNEIRRQWEAALRKVGDIKGWEVQGKPYGEVIELVVKEVLHKLKLRQRPLDNKLFGVDEQVKAIMKLLDVDSGTGVRFVGIHGMGGIGKTTLAKVVFNMLCRRFDSQCSFIENIRESSKRNGLVDLQKQLASEISDSRFVKDISNTDEGIRSIKSRAGSKKVLIVLDDLDDEEQLKKLVAGPETFASGSTIIITTRDKKILDEEKRILTYEVKEMDPDKALELFTWHAFRSLSPPDTHESLSREVASTTGGLPLALEVIGSSLRGKGKTIWEEMLKRLKKAPHNKVQEKLKISYDALGDMEKEIFLDIACFFVNEKKSSATYFWDACDLSPHIALEELSDLCLIKIDKSDDIWMHDQLRDLGRDIVRQECTRNPTGRSRLWNSQEALKVVRSKERKDKVQALNLVQHCSDPISIAEEELERMPNLKFLKLRAATFVGDVNEYLLDLTWLSWDSPPPLDCRMANLHLENLAVFELSDNRNTENWDGWNILKMAAKLKVLSLTRCKGLKRTPDFSGCVSLERLSFYDCPNLQEVDSSIGKLERLTNLDIIWCKSLRTLPEEIGGLVNLKLFYMRGCKKLDKLPSSIWKLASFSRLFIPSTGITRLPNSIGNAKHLLSIDLGYTPIGELPTFIGELTQLEYLSLHQCTNIRELPESIGKLTSLEYLYLSETTIVELPDSIKNLTRLKVLSVAGTLIRRLPASIGSLVRLELLDARHCKELEGELPPDIGKLLSLRELDLSNTRICAVPTTINSLTLLQKLDLTDCNELQELPELPSSLKYLRVRSTSLRLVADLKNLTNLVEFLCQGSGQAPAQASNPMQTLPLSLCPPEPSTDSNSVVFGLQLSHVKNLARLDLSRSPLREIQLNGLEPLRDLAVRECEFLEVLSISLGKLRQMEVFDCPKLHEVRFLGEMELLEKLHVKNCNSLGKLSSLSNLKKLKSLLVDECDELRDLEGLEEMELLSFLSFVRCGSLERLTHAPKSKPKIPNGCRMYVLDCAKFQGPNRSTFSYEDYWKEEMKKRETAS